MFYIDTYENTTLHCSVRGRFLADIFPLLRFRGVVDALHDCHVLKTIVIFDYPFLVPVGVEHDLRCEKVVIVKKK
jgi:hypothetical protein